MNIEKAVICDYCLLEADGIPIPTITIKKDGACGWCGIPQDIAAISKQPAVTDRICDWPTHT